MCRIYLIKGKKKRAVLMAAPFYSLFRNEMISSQSSLVKLCIKLISFSFVVMFSPTAILIPHLKKILTFRYGYCNIFPNKNQSPNMVFEGSILLLKVSSLFATA